GFPKPEVDISTKPSDEGLIVIYKVNTGAGIIISKLNIKTDIAAFSDDLKSSYDQMIGENWNIGLARQISEQIETSYFARGFWSIDVDSKLVEGDKENVIEVKANFGPQYLFTFRGLTAFSRVELVNRIRDV